MILRLLVVLGLLGLAGCVTTPDYRYVSSTGGYYYGDSGGDGYYADDGYYGNGSGYYAGYGAYVGTTGYGLYPVATWGFSPWFGYGGYNGYAGWGLGFANYGPYGFRPGWSGYFGSGWGGYGYSPFYASYFPYWYYSSYTRHRDRNRRDLRAVHAEQLRQADYQRSLNRAPHAGAGIRMWAPPGRSVASGRTQARVSTRNEAVRQATLQRERTPARRTPRHVRDTTPVSTTRSRYEVMPRGGPARRDIQMRPSRPVNTMPVRSYNRAPRGMPAPRSAPREQPRAAAPRPTRSVPRSMPAPQPRVSGNHGPNRKSHRESHRR